jgi:hypothetical protein
MLWGIDCEGPFAIEGTLKRLHFENLQDVAQRRTTLAGYRIADLILAADDEVSAEQKFAAGK